MDDKTRFGDIQWGGVGVVDLTTIRWDNVRKLGDERIDETAVYLYDIDALLKERISTTPLDARYEAAVRAYRQLAAESRAHGMNEVADRFTYRAQVCQRRALRLQGVKKLPAYFGSLFLAIFSGYGYRIWRIFAVYVLTVAAFAAVFFWIGIPNDPATSTQDQAFNALLVSLTAIHGRTFFEQFAFTLQGWIAAIESIVGIVIEGVFVAMLIQRFFGR